MNSATVLSLTGEYSRSILRRRGHECGLLFTLFKSLLFEKGFFKILSNLSTICTYCIICQDLDVEGAENEDEDSGGDEHPALRNSLPNSRRYRLFKTSPQQSEISSF
jgi:hypothetical protein